MQHRDWKVRIDDILDAIGKIQRYTKGMTRQSFSADSMIIDAVARNIEIIGEAARHVPADIRERYPGVPWADMRGMRNVVAHDYSRVDVDILWDTLERNLPPLVPLLREILEREPS